MLDKIMKVLAINLPGHVQRSRDPRTILLAVWAAWIPLSTAVLVSVIEQLPSPAAAQHARVPRLLDASPGASSISETVRTAMQGLKSLRTEPTICFVSKMVSVPEKDLPQNKTRSGKSLSADEARELGRKKRAEIARAQAAANGEHPDVAELRETLSGAAIGGSGVQEANRSDKEPEQKEHLIGFARLFSGTLELGDELYVLSPKFSPANAHAPPEPQKVTITALYLLMGRELESLNVVPPGVVFGIGGLEGHVMKSATLSSQLDGSVNLAGISMGGQPIVRVALEPENPSDLDKMVRGMRLLEQSDPCARYEVLENGEHVILTAGELHLERCLKDLRERLAGCEIQVGAPIVPYRESIVSASEMNAPKNKNLPRGTVLTTLPSNAATLRLRVCPLPVLVVEYLQKNVGLTRQLYEKQKEEAEDALDGDDDAAVDTARRDGQISSDASGSLAYLQKGLIEALKQSRADKDVWKDAAQHTIAFGPRNHGPSLLIDATEGQICRAR